MPLAGVRRVARGGGHPTVGRRIVSSAGVSLLNEIYPPQTIISLPVQTALWAIRPKGALLVLVSVQESVSGLYLPPVLKAGPPLKPPQTIISLPVQIPDWPLAPLVRRGALCVSNCPWTGYIFRRFSGKHG